MNKGKPVRQVTAQPVVHSKAPDDPTWSRVSPGWRRSHHYNPSTGVGHDLLPSQSFVECQTIVGGDQQLNTVRITPSLVQDLHEDMAQAFAAMLWLGHNSVVDEDAMRLGPVAAGCQDAGVCDNAD